ncbi:MAG: YggT family protein [Desulfatitalea sp.]|nr:YggT family protein [Desulfatitalea sp.]NNJ98911.1 YggT family protein [Desulfatitalea sp.]
MAVAKIGDLLLSLYLLVMLARVIMSWISITPYHPVVRFIYAITDPVLSKIRTKVPLVYGGIDFSPMAVLFGIYFLRLFLQPLFRFGSSLL